MDGVTEHTLYELHLSTGSNRCKYIGGGRYEFALEYQEFRPQKTMLMGVKNVKIPQFEKHLDLQKNCFSDHGQIRCSVRGMVYSN